MTSFKKKEREWLCSEWPVNEARNRCLFFYLIICSKEFFVGTWAKLYFVGIFYETWNINMKHFGRNFFPPPLILTYDAISAAHFSPTFANLIGIVLCNYVRLRRRGVVISQKRIPYIFLIILYIKRTGVKNTLILGVHTLWMTPYWPRSRLYPIRSDPRVSIKWTVRDRKILRGHFPELF